MKTSPRKALMASAFLVSSASAQDPYRIDPNSVSNTTRDFWCQQQITQCPLICLTSGSSSGTTNSNDCDPAQLTYSCVCDNGLSPNVSEYSQTLPYYICTEWGSQCVSNCGNGNNDCSAACRENHPCGARNPTRQNTSTLTSTMSPTASGSGSAAGAVVTTDSNGQVETLYTGFGGASPTGKNGEESKASQVRVWALSVGQTFGTLSVLGMAALGFAVLL